MGFFASCGRTHAICTREIVVDPATGLPFRLILADREADWDGRVDTAIPSLFWSDGSTEVGFWDFFPLFLPTFLASHEAAWPRAAQVAGHAIDFDYRNEGRSWIISFATERIHRFVGENEDVEIQISGRIWLQDSLDPTRIDMQIETFGEVLPSSLFRSYVRESAQSQVPWTHEGNDSGGERLTPLPACGKDLEHDLFVGSDFDYAAAFRVVQDHAAFKRAHDNDDTLLLRMEHEPPAKGPLAEDARWTFWVRESAEVARYVVEANNPLSVEGVASATPRLVERKIVEGNEIPGDPGAWNTLVNAPCVGIDRMESRIQQWISVGAFAGYRRVSVSGPDPDLSFDVSDGQPVPLASAYLATVQPWWTTPDSIQVTGPRLDFSIITGNVTMIS